MNDNNKHWVSMDRLPYEVFEDFDAMVRSNLGGRYVEDVEHINYEEVPKVMLYTLISRLSEGELDKLYDYFCDKEIDLLLEAEYLRLSDLVVDLRVKEDQFFSSVRNAMEHDGDLHLFESSFPRLWNNLLKIRCEVAAARDVELKSMLAKKILNQLNVHSSHEIKSKYGNNLVLFKKK